MVHTAFFVSALSLVLVGLFGVLTRRNIIRILLALNILATGVNLFLVAVGYAPGKAAPIVRETVSGPSMPFVDPLPQAMVLTAIVIGLGTTALALAIAVRHYRCAKTLELTPKEARRAS
jgi:multisubunit Na+/H+ antiporter MnhC subunit